MNQFPTLDEPDAPEDATRGGLNDEFKYIMESLLIMARARDVETLLPEVAARLKRAFDFDRLNLALFNADGRTYQLRTFFEARPEAPPVRQEAVPLERGVVGRLLASGKTSQVLSLSTDTFGAVALADEWLEAGSLARVLSIRLEADGRPLGVLSMGTRLNSGYQRSEVELIYNFAVHLGFAIERLRHLGKLRSEIEERKQQQEALRASEERYRTLFETIDQGFCVVEMLFDEHGKPVDYRFLEANPTFEQQTGLIQAVGKTASELVPNLEAHWFEVYGRVALTGEPARFENGSEPMGRWFDVYAYRAGSPEERKVGILFTDISERKRAEEALHNSEARLRAVYDTTNQYMGLLSPAGTVLEANRAALQFIDYPREEVVGLPFWETAWWTHTPGAAEQVREAVERAAGGESVRHEVTLRSPAGKVAIFDFSLHPIRDERGEVILIVPEASDITQRKHLEEERERLIEQVEVERSRLQYLFDSAPTFLALMRGPDHVFEIINPAFSQLVGHRDLIGKTAREAFPDIEGQGFFELLAEVFQTGKQYIGREIHISFQPDPGAPPEERVLNFVYKAFLEADGTVSGIFAHGVDVTEQVAARTAIEEANRLKDEFLATLSHELRNPLNSILGYSEVLRRNPEARQSPIIRQAADTIRSNAEAQAHLINDLLDLSRLQTGKLAVERRPLHLAPLIGDAVETVREQAGEKGIKLNVDLPAEPLTVNADPVRLQQIVWNLVNNAVKFTPKGGRVSVCLTDEGDEAALVVEDNGQGIAAEFLPYVFEMFRQGDARTTRKQGGMGIGLALVRQLTELHGGRAEVYSEGPGLGARFTVRLPLHSAALVDRNTAPPAQTTGELSGMRILVVDDTQDSLDVLRLLLAGEGAEVEVALSGAEGLSAVGNSDFDLVISDISMPEMDGYEFLQALRANPRYTNTPAIALTGFGRDEDVERARQAGFTTHLTKPLDFDNLVKLARVTLLR